MEDKKNMDLYKFFTTNNLSGYKTKEKTLQSRHPDMYQELITFISKLDFAEELTFKEKIWHYINNETERQICKECSSPLKFGKDLRAGYPKYCSVSCMNKNYDHINKVKKTCNVKFGGNAPTNSIEIRNKGQKTLFKNYGVSNPMHSKYIRNKLIETNIKNFGVKNFSNTIESKQRFLENYRDLGVVDVGNGTMTFLCNKCGETSIIKDYFFFYRRNNNITICPKCNKPKQFAKQNDLYLYIKSLINEAEKNNRRVIKPYEIDVYVPSNKIGFELNGLYWHSELFNDKNDHIKKQQISENNNIKLFQIFEDEWDDKKEIVKSMIKNKLNLNENTIYARNCIVKEITSTEAKDFIDKTHLQGYTTSKIKLGLFFNNELVSVMTFGNLRIYSGWKDRNKTFYEIIRFSSKLNTNVIGGAGKLLKYFENTYKPTKIITYADRRFSQGNLYLNLGFKFIKHTQPNYFYIIKNKRKHRFNFRKNKLVELGYDQNKTEKQIMKEKGILKIFDCGSLLFEKNF